MTTNPDGVTPVRRRVSPAQVTAMLLELMQASASDAARIAAAKLLLERMTPKKTTDAAHKRDTAARTAAIKEAEALLAQLAAAQLGGADQPAALDRERKARTADTPALGKHILPGHARKKRAR